jgi:hypothetical protein
LGDEDHVALGLELDDVGVHAPQYEVSHTGVAVRRDDLGREAARGILEPRTPWADQQVGMERTVGGVLEEPDRALLTDDSFPHVIETTAPMNQLFRAAVGVSIHRGGG